ncbi:MAG: hypothetical protein JW864_14155 [Spirochaetes bacterium]|nr:hypothetical protein [Spirochaetota bacterium]
MLIEGKVTLKAPIQKIWDSVLKPEILSSCVPGGETMEKKSDTLYEGTMKQKVGPFAAKIKYVATLVEMDKPTHIKADMKGEMLGGLGQFIADLSVDFNDIGGGDVEVSYKVNATITGKIAVVGDRIMRVKAKSIEKDMAKNFQEKLV